MKLNTVIRVLVVVAASSVVPALTLVLWPLLPPSREHELRTLSEALRAGDLSKHASPRLWKIAFRPEPPYEGWLEKVGVLTAADPGGIASRGKGLWDAGKTLLGKLRLESPKARGIFIQTVAARGYACNAFFILVGEREWLRFFADELSAEDPKTAACCVWVLSEGIAASPPWGAETFPAGRLKRLAEIAQAGDPTEAAEAQGILRAVIGSAKPDKQSWLEWATPFAGDSVLLRCAMTRAKDPALGEDERIFAVEQSLSLAANAGQDEFARCAKDLLSLAESGHESTRFRGPIVVRSVTNALRQIDAPSVAREVRQLLVAWMDATEPDLRIEAVYEIVGLPGIAQDRQVKEKIWSILNDPAASFLLRANAADSLRVIRKDDVELKRATLRLLTEAESQGADERSRSLLRETLGELTGKPAETSVETWEKMLRE